MSQCLPPLPLSHLSLCLSLPLVPVEPLSSRGPGEAAVHPRHLHCSVGMRLVDLHPLPSNQLKSLSFSRGTSITLCAHHQPDVPSTVNRTPVFARMKLEPGGIVETAVSALHGSFLTRPDEPGAGADCGKHSRDSCSPSTVKCL